MNDDASFEPLDIAIVISGVHDAASAPIDLSDVVVADGATLCRLIARS